MSSNFFSSLLSPSRENLLSIDIGSNSIKVMELKSTPSGKMELMSAGQVPTPANVIKNNVITKPEAIGNAIKSLVESNAINTNQVVTAVPGPSVFTKRITTAAVSLKELHNNITYEAGNYIPHTIDAVHLDYQVLGSNGKSSMDVLLVAVKNEIIRSFLESIEHAGLETVVVDVDYFALENMFALNYPEECKKTLALINIGARYSTVNILQDGVSLFTGDVTVGGRLYTDALCESLALEPLVAEQAKMGRFPETVDKNIVTETLDRTTEHIAAELHRQIGFFWSAAATDRQIEAVYLAGGGAQVSGLVDELNSRTGMQVHIVDSFRAIDATDRFDTEYLNEIAPAMSVSVGLALRTIGDKEHAIP